MQAALGTSSETVAAPVLQVGAVTKRFGALTVLDGCSLNVGEGEIVTLLGPSGCGKTTLLRCIAGFGAPDAGKIVVDGRDMVRAPVNRRPVGVVFQSYALFPHLTVAKNVGYGLRVRGLPRAQIAERIRDALATVSLTGLEERYPAQLSGGQQQRVAIARVLVLEPRVLLLDEPFNALDAKLRGAMQVELRQLIKRLGMTSIFVTHDQEEALTMSDRIAVMRAGQIEQVGPPEDVFDRPASAYVADFIGSSNFIALQAEAGRAVLPDGQTLPTTRSGPIRVMARPHNVRLQPGSAGPWRGLVKFHRSIGPLIEYHVETQDGAMVQVVAMRQERTRPLADEMPVTLGVIDPELCAVYEA
ncbi:MAG: ABC transporter ATP-binding protein [Pseudomonadota bacterium]